MSNQKIWFTADQHFNHLNIIKYCNRPFKTVDEMNQVMVERWNSVVKPGDCVYHLGDAVITGYSKSHVGAVTEILSKLNGTKILITGNHDSPAVLNCKEWAGIYRLHHISHADQRIIMCHYPMRSWQFKGHGSWQLFGHCHGNMKVPDNEYTADVGVDCWDFYPVSFEQLQEKFKHISWNKDENLV